jgi:membrane protein
MRLSPRAATAARQTARDWLDIARDTLAASVTDRVSLAAGGCAFFSTLALFPAMSLLIAAYGLLFRAHTIEPQLQYLRELLPPETFALIERWMHYLVLQSNRRLRIGIGVSSVITIWSAAIGTRALLATLNAAYGAGRRSGFLLQNAIALSLTLAAIAVVILGTALLTLMPVAITLLDLAPYRMRLTHLIGSFLLVMSASFFIALLYRIGPSGGMAPGRRIIPGTVLATILWLLASALLTVYVDDVARFSMTYGPVGAIIGLMLWLYFTFYAVLMGAELNARLGRSDDPARPFRMPPE